MRLIESNKPDAQEALEIKAILNHASPPIKMADLIGRKITHRQTAWRNVVFYAMAKHRKASKCKLARWFDVTPRTVWGGIAIVQRTVEKKDTMEAKLIEKVTRHFS